MQQARPLRLMVLALALPLLPALVSCPSSAPAPTNVILISLDTLRADHLGTWGYGRSTSPRIDEFARRSVVFRRAVAQGSSTIPSHASLFTSQYPSAVRVPSES